MMALTFEQYKKLYAPASSELEHALKPRQEKIEENLDSMLYSKYEQYPLNVVKDI